MKEPRIRIVDIADELGLSTATVSNVIHGKTKKISDETVHRVEDLLEKKQYIPSMAGILLAQNDSKIIGVVIHDHEKYENHVLEDNFVASSLNCLSTEIEKAGYFLMVKVTKDWNEIAKFASMWNMEGLISVGFCEQEYHKLRNAMHIPFIVYDGFFKNPGRICNLLVDNYDGGWKMGDYFRSLGHKKVLCISDNDLCMDHDRYHGFVDGMGGRGADFLMIPMLRQERFEFYHRHLSDLRQYTAIFAVSDYYAIDLIQFLTQQGIQIPNDISISGFDDSPLCERIVPTLTTIHQDGNLRASLAVEYLQKLKSGEMEGQTITLPVSVIERQSTKRLN